MIFKTLSLIATLLLCGVSSTRAAEKSLPAAPRIVVRDGRFVNEKNGEIFVPRGFNYTRLGGKANYHVTFAPSRYDKFRAERMFRDLQQNDFNVVRVFAAAGFQDASDASGVKPQLFANALDFLRRARRHDVRVIFTLDWIPPGKRYAQISGAEPDDIHGVSLLYLSASHIRAKARFLRDFIAYVKKHDVNLLTSVFSWELENEAFLDVKAPPFSLVERKWKYQNGTYDLSDERDLQKLADIGARQWANALVDAAHAEDPKALVAASVFTFAAVGRSGPNALRRDKSPDTRFPLRALALAGTRISYLDIHLYALDEKGLQRDLDSIEWPRVLAQCRATGKPLMMGEFGAFRGAFPSATAAAPAIRAHLRRVAKLGFAGFLMWTYDTHEQTELFNAKSEGGVLFDAFKTEMRALLPDLKKKTRVLAAPAKDKVLLRLKLNVGQRFVFRVRSDNITSTNVIRPRRQRWMMALAVRVLAVAPNGTMTVRMHIAGMRTTSDDGRRDVDAASPFGVSMVKMRKATGDVPFTAQVTPTGKLFDVRGIDRWRKHIASFMPKALKRLKAEPVSRAWIYKMLSQPFGYLAYPTSAVGVGEKWHDKIRIMTSASDDFPFANMTYRLLKRENGIATVIASGRIPSQVLSDEAGVREKMSGTQFLQFQIDEKTGLSHLITGVVNTDEETTVRGQMKGRAFVDVYKSRGKSYLRIPMGSY